ncbi:unnamed protein product [Musa acuminata subsp. burmannicoides]
MKVIKLQRMALLCTSSALDAAPSSDHINVAGWYNNHIDPLFKLWYVLELGLVYLNTGVIRVMLFDLSDLIVEASLRKTRLRKLRHLRLRRPRPLLLLLTSYKFKPEQLRKM